MTRLQLAPAVFDDLDRFIEHMQKFDVANIEHRTNDLIAALDILSHSPLIGRPARAGKRELLIGRDSHAYIALYQYVADIDTVFVLAVRNQRESGFKRRRR